MSLRANPNVISGERGNPCLPAGRSLPIGHFILTGLLRRSQALFSAWFAPRNDNKT